MGIRQLIMFMGMLLLSMNVYADDTILAPCDSKTHQSEWYTISPDGDLIVKIQSQSVEPPPTTCKIQTTAWNRNHWTVTCWVQMSAPWYTEYRCHNWNTVWGDSWKASFMYMACPSSGCVTDAKEAKLLSDMMTTLADKDTAPTHFKVDKQKVQTPKNKSTK